jgi:hypothetical protein
VLLGLGLFGLYALLGGRFTGGEDESEEESSSADHTSSSSSSSGSRNNSSASSRTGGCFRCCRRGGDGDGDDASAAEPETHEERMRRLLGKHRQYLLYTAVLLSLLCVCLSPLIPVILCQVNNRWGSFSGEEEAKCDYGVRTLLQPHCAAILQYMHRNWFRAVVGCEKYSGKAYVIDYAASGASGGASSSAEAAPDTYFFEDAYDPALSGGSATRGGLEGGLNRVRERKDGAGTGHFLGRCLRKNYEVYAWEDNKVRLLISISLSLPLSRSLARSPPPPPLCLPSN